MFVTSIFAVAVSRCSRGELYSRASPTTNVSAKNCFLRLVGVLIMFVFRLGRNGSRLENVLKLLMEETMNYLQTLVTRLRLAYGFVGYVVSLPVGPLLNRMGTLIETNRTIQSD